MENFSIEELKTATGHLMLDLRGNWGYEYSSRMNELCLLLNLLILKDPDNELTYKSDLETTESEIEEPYDGRIFRDQCNLYCYSSNSGKTIRVKNYLEKILKNPEYNQIEVFS